MDLNAKTLFTLRLGGHNIGITDSIVTQWVIMVVIVILVLALTRNLKKLPDKKQSVLEMLIDFFNGLVRENMGEKYMSFVPFIGTMGIFLFFLNLTGLVGVDPSTKDISVTAGFAIISFVVINVNTFSKIGIGGFGKELISPYILMLPMNLLEKITLPISLCLRLFCNMLVGFIIIGLIYKGMGYFAFIVPIPFHLFFDMFDGVIQVYIFMMLTMLYTKMGGELE